MSVRFRRIRRRKFLKLGFAAASAGTLTSCGRSGGGAYWRCFTPAEARTAEAICERIIPKDEFAGAAEAGVVRFIDRQLTRQYRKHQAAYREGLAAVEAAGREKFQKAFPELSAEEQTEILQEIQEKHAEFFGLVRAHTMQGYYGDPRHGGNQDAVSWKMLGLPDPPVRGRLPYEKELS